MTGVESPASPSCPICGGVMTLRITRRGVDKGAHFWGCSSWPSCRGWCPSGEHIFMGVDKTYSDGLRTLKDEFYSEGNLIGEGDIYGDKADESKWDYGDDDPDHDPWDY